MQVKTVQHGSGTRGNKSPVTAELACGACALGNAERSDASSPWGYIQEAAGPGGATLRRQSGLYAQYTIARR
jgi:hypothetical protein